MTTTDKRPITLGHSPDSDDAFMFYGMAEHKIDLAGLEFEHILRDIETLNQWATEGRLDITAISVHAYAYVADKYDLLTHGASMGDNYGPMIVTREPAPVESLAGKLIAVPGKMTSAALGLALFLAEKGVEARTTIVPFDQIMDAVKAGKVDAGLLIHEGQLTHAREGLHKVVDLGEWWHAAYGLPLPLGVNAIRRDLDPRLQTTLNRVLHDSIAYGLDHRQAGVEHAMQFARDMDTKTADTFVGMYVNHWTLDMGEKGRRSIELFLGRAAEAGLVPNALPLRFVL
ncbi:MAG TPA: MqnA/MqnD/SBP family protein [Armatimonadota bacterium]|jgi:1,4-dihydroxy-6-naphthoate synthase